MKKISQKGSVHAVIVLGLVIVIAGLLSIILWQNFIAKKPPLEQLNTTSTVKQKDTSAEVELPQDIDFTKETEGGLVIVKVADVNAMTNVSSQLKEFLKRTLSDKLAMVQAEPVDASCGEPQVTITLKRVYKQQYATGGISTSAGDCAYGGAAYLWADVDGGWREIGGTQNDGFGCANLEKYKIPSEIAGTQCFASDGSGVKPYNQE